MFPEGYVSKLPWVPTFEHTAGSRSLKGEILFPCILSYKVSFLTIFLFYFHMFAYGKINNFAYLMKKIFSVMEKFKTLVIAPENVYSCQHRCWWGECTSVGKE